MADKFIYPISIYQQTESLYDEQADIYKNIFIPISPNDAAKYLNELVEATHEETVRCLGSKGFMESFWSMDKEAEKSIENKVTSAFPGLDVIDGQLYGIIKIDNKTPLSEVESEVLKDYLVCQMIAWQSVVMERRPIATPDGDIYVDFLTDDNFSMATEREFSERHHSTDTQTSEQDIKLQAQVADRIIKSSESQQEGNDYMTEKLYYPINASMCFYDNSDRYSDRNYDIEEIDQTQAAEYLPEVFMAVALDNKRFLNERGLMAYFWTENRDLEDSINFKVISAAPTVEKINGKLYGVTELELRVPLTLAELSALKDYITGQMSDGYGEGFEQHEIKTRDGELYISFWSSGGNYFVDTQQEFNQRLAMESGQELNNTSMKPPSI